MDQGAANFNGVPQFANDPWLRSFADTVRIRCQRAYNLWLQDNQPSPNTTPAIWVLPWAQHAYPGANRKLQLLLRQHQEQTELAPIFEADVNNPERSDELLDHHWAGFEEEVAQVQTQLIDQREYVNFIRNVLTNRDFRTQLQMWINRVTTWST